ncbi:monocarboxylate transporter 14-like [Saccostrea echinata]|uniref:monocarboxylate transporter 14-like n=1 Tax=Saccostrea echinata TaxID=191078 RepID=UPI002A7FCCBA|nr:monocarboxylate transporter 14-like [Saccostrea echinata]
MLMEDDENKIAGNSHDSISELHSDNVPSILIEKEENVVPDGGWGWWVVLGSFFCHFIIGGLERSSGLLYLYFLERYKQTAAATAWATTIPSGIRLLLGPLCSLLCNKFSSRTVVITGSLIFTVTLIITAYSPSLITVYVFFGFVGGFGRSLSYAPAVTMVGTYFNKRRGIAIGIATSGVGFGSFVVPAIVELAFHFYLFTGGFYILACFAVNLCVCGMLFRPLEKQRKLMAFDKRRKSIKDGAEVPLKDTKTFISHDSLNEHSKDTSTKVELSNDEKMVLRETEDETGVVTDSKFIGITERESPFPDNPREREAFQNGSVKNGERNRKCGCCGFFKTGAKSSGPKKKYLELSLLKDYRFLCFCIAIMLFTLAFQSAFVFLPAYGKQIGTTDMEAAYLVIITGVFDGVARLISGTVLDLKNVKRFRVYVYNTVMFLVGGMSFVIPFTRSYSQLCVVCGVYGLLIGTYISQKSVILVDLLGAEKLVNSFGLLIAFQGVGMLVGPPFAGFLKDIDGRYENAFYVGGSAMLMGAVVLLISNIRHLTMSRNKKQ